jgi:lysozyme family protein
MSSQKVFDAAMIFLFDSEGGLSDDLYDMGGLTKYGITQKKYPDLDIANLTRSDAKKIYYRDYWLKIKCNVFAAPLAIVLFDSGVNCGTGSAAKWLQKSCNKLGANLKIDGRIGPKTINACLALPHRKVLDHIIAYRLDRYFNLTKRHPTQMRFIRGWMRRAANLLRYSTKF